MVVDIDIGRTTFNNGTIKIIQQRKPQIPFVQLLRKITFFKRDKNVVGGIIQDTVAGSSMKLPSDEDHLLEDSAFRSCLAQINFSYDYFKEIDKAYLFFIKGLSQSSVKSKALGLEDD